MSESAVAALASTVRELETHAAGAGWDQPARLFALVDTADLLRRQPDLAEVLGHDTSVPGPESLTPVEQELAVPDDQLEGLLETIVWPADVVGCAVVVERLVLPPEADGTLPTDAAGAAAYAQQHPARQEVRIVVGVTRAGAAYCALRLRSHDDDLSVMTGPDLVPGLVARLAATLDEETM